MTRLALAMAVMAAPVLATQSHAACPAAPDRSAELLDLFAEVRAAEGPAAAQPITNRMWAIWADAPDELAQEILNRGMRKRAEQDFLGAMADFDRLIDYCPDYAEGYNQRAFVRFILQDFKNALDDLDAALARSPNHLAAQAGRALTLLGLGREEEGQAALRAALEIHPWLPERRLLKALDEQETDL